MTDNKQYKNIIKVVAHTGTGSLKDEAKRGGIIKSLSAITGLNPSARKAKKSIASFKLREGQVIGYAVTLRGKKMRDFLVRFIEVAIPRTRDFRGLPAALVDDMGNITIGLKDHTVFPEMSDEDVRTAFGLEATIVTKAKDKESGREMLEKIGLPFTKER